MRSADAHIGPKPGSESSRRLNGVARCAALMIIAASADVHAWTAEPGRPSGPSTRAADSPASAPIIIYRYTTHDGRVLYSDRKMAGAPPEKIVTVGPFDKKQVWSAQQDMKDTRHPWMTRSTGIAWSGQTD
jgi:hypothetical protein